MLQHACYHRERLYVNQQTDLRSAALCINSTGGILTKSTISNVSIALIFRFEISLFDFKIRHNELCSTSSLCNHIHAVGWWVVHVLIEKLAFAMLKNEIASLCQ